jgi:hypothetical protein
LSAQTRRQQLRIADDLARRAAEANAPDLEHMGVVCDAERHARVLQHEREHRDGLIFLKKEIKR